MRKLQKSLIETEQTVVMQERVLTPFHSLSEEEKSAIFDKISQIISHPESEKFYYGKVFSECIQFIKAKLLDEQTKHFKSKLKGKFERALSVKDIAQMAGLEYFQLRDLSFGKNTSSTLLKFMTFTKKHDVSIEEFMYHPSIINTAYQYYCMLEKDTVRQ
jgi:Na+-transporting NADH:ubiquinone oxidoreductase subunit NqrC